jgi:hypothetical protein
LAIGCIAGWQPAGRRTVGRVEDFKIPRRNGSGFPSELVILTLWRIANPRYPRELRPFLLQSAANANACKVQPRKAFRSGFFPAPRLFSRLFVFIVSICIYLNTVNLYIY